MLNGYFGQADYDKRNPVFGKTREDDLYGASATVYYTNPWGWSLSRQRIGAFLRDRRLRSADSNIDFYNQQALLGMGGVAFRWK